MFVTEHKLKIIGLLAVLVLFLSTTSASTPPQEDSSPREMIAEVFKQTKKATSASDYSAIIDECERLNRLELAESETEYVHTLLTWGHRRRGEARLATAEQLASAGNDGEAGKLLDMAIEDFDVAVTSKLKQERTLRLRANARTTRASEEANDYAAAIKDLSQALEIEADHLPTRFNRAELFRATGQFEPAIADYDFVLETDSADLQALTGRGHALYGADRFAEALKDYSAVAVLQPDDAVAILNRGEAHYMLGNYTAANSDFRKSVELRPSAAGCLRAAWLAATSPEAELFDAIYALETARQAVELGGETPQTLDTLAAAEASNGNFDDARTHQSRAIELAEARADDNTSAVKRMAMYNNQRPFKANERRDAGDSAESTLFR